MIKKAPVFLLFMLVPAASFGQISWKTNLQAGKQASAVSRKPILVMFHASWCEPCHEMEKETFRDSRVVKLLQGLICIKLDVDHEEATARSFGVSSIPRILLLPPGGANTPLMDTLGYRDAEDFANELSAALHLKAPVSTGGGSESPELAAVYKALGDHTFAQLRQANPTLAAAGLKRLVEELGVFQEHDIDPTVAVLRTAGDSAIPALFTGMGHRYLAVRTGAYRALQTLVRERRMNAPLAFDPWAPIGVRQRQVEQWSKWWKTRSHS